MTPSSQRWVWRIIRSRKSQREKLSELSRVGARDLRQPRPLTRRPPLRKPSAQRAGKLRRVESGARDEGASEGKA